MQDMLGRNIEVGDQVVVATTSYRRTRLRTGTIKSIVIKYRTEEYALVRTSVGGHTSKPRGQILKTHDSRQSQLYARDADGNETPMGNIVAYFDPLLK